MNRAVQSTQRFRMTAHDFPFHHLWNPTYVVQRIIETSAVMRELTEGKAALTEQESTCDSMPNYRDDRYRYYHADEYRWHRYPGLKQSSMSGILWMYSRRPRSDTGP